MSSALISIADTFTALEVQSKLLSLLLRLKIESAALALDTVSNQYTNLVTNAMQSYWSAYDASIAYRE